MTQGGPRGATPWRQIEGFVFVITYGRSGSTVLMNLLNAIDGYCIRGENNNALFSLYQGWAAVAQSSNLRFLRNRGTPTTPEQPWYGGETTRPRALRDGVVRTFCDAVLAPPPGTRVSGFKEIRHPRDPDLFRGYMDFLLQAFPQAKIVFNTRHHADVVKSGMFADKSPEAVTRRLRLSDDLFAAYAAANNDRCLVLHYDDWKGRPEAMRPLFTFLGAPYDAARVTEILNTRLTHMQAKGRAN